ncbi:ribonuclease P protein component [Aequorivita xiaoshiensis]|uniref:Ribonuclease P protein component n=1 Tax=Aequorivita xiaoshiensis TaxID=2874476 RepID=A0A9X1QXX0_9FLAO|nr:ribonuclease P protein component [Aequorivita xiaoshiensis]
MNKKFPKTEKLKSTKTIETLFSEGRTYTKFPIKVFFLPNKEIDTNLAAFAVPKRNFKSAVDRNRVKRQLREVYRLHKHLIEESGNTRFKMLFLYLGKVKPEYVQLEKSMLKLLKKLQEDNS